MIRWVLEQITQGKCLHRWGYGGNTHLMWGGERIETKTTLICVKCGAVKETAYIPEHLLSALYKESNHE